MTDIEIKYKWLWCIPVVYKRKMPTGWDECNLQQIVAITRVYYNLIDDDGFMAKMLSMPKRVIKKLDDYLMLCLSELLIFIEDFTACDKFIVNKIGKYEAILPKLEGVSFAQFMFIDTYFSDYITSEKDEDLNKFTACVFFKEGFNEKDISKRVNYLKKKSKHEKMAAAINYRLIIEWLIEKYPEVFRRKEEIEGKKERDVSLNQQQSDWIKVFDAIVGDDIVNSDKYAKKNVHEVFRFLTRKIKENAKRKKV